MPPSSRFILACLFSVMLAAFSGQAFAGNTAAGLCTAAGTHYATIQEAVNAAELLTPPSTVRVCPGTYPEQVLITQSLTLIGVADAARDNDAPVILPPSGGLVQNGTDIFGNGVAAQIFVQGPGITVTVSDLTVDGTGNNIASCGPPTLEGIYFQNAYAKISGNVVRNQYMTDFGVYGGCQNALAINVESPDQYGVTISGNSVRAYQKNGITVTGGATGPGSYGPLFTISNNYVTGLGATGMNWPTCPDYQVCAGTPDPEVNGGAGENGIQVCCGAYGTVESNVVNDNIWWGEYAEYNYDGGVFTGPTSDNGASGILVYASEGITVTSNIVGSAQFGIAVVSDYDGSDCIGGASCGGADETTIESNKISGTQVFDAIDLCSNSNKVQSNAIYGSGQAAVHVDDECSFSIFTSGNSNTVKSNTINEACAGILLGTGSGNTTAPNVFYNVVNTTLAGDSCTSPTYAMARRGTAKRSAFRASPYIPAKNKK
jgi:hypothetical protein